MKGQTMKSSFWDRSSRYNQLQTVRSCAGWVAPLFFIANVFAQTAPTVLTQPQSQAAIAGTNVTLSVIAAGGAPPPLPAATSGNLRLWLKADTGVITNSAGHVSQWQDQSGNANHAAQTDANEQPLLASATGLAGNPVVRFNGIQDGVNGDYLQGAGDVGVSNAMTTFVVYNVFSTTNAVDLVWLIGVPGVVYGASRADCVIGGGDMLFSTWTYDYPTSFAVPTNTYRIWTDRINTNLTTLEMFDNSAHGSTNFALAMANAVAPAPGYYVGGLNPSVQYVATSRCFDGDIAELICYRGYLTDADRMAVTNYLGQKYFQIGSNNLTYQWQFDGTNIANATNATLTMTDLQITNDGVYTVIVSNLAGVTTSSNAVLTVGNAPSISVQPQSQEVGQGSNVTFTVSVTGTAPFSFQWSLGGVALAGSTNSALTLTNVQSATAGAYAVTVSSPFGTSVSSNVTLTVDLFPVIETQPQSQALLVGTNVTFSVNVEGSVLPSVSSGTLQLWLKADAGVVTNSAGQVSQWQDQSGNANHASQSVANNQPTLVSAARLAGKPAIRFNGIQDNVNGDYLSATRNVGVPNALTTFAVYNSFSNEPNGSAMWFIGQPPAYGAGRADALVGGKMVFSTWAYDYYAPFLSPTNTYRIWTTVLNSNLTAAQVYDNSAGASTNYSAIMSNSVTPAAGYYVGGLNPAVQYVGSSRCFDGDITELVCYSGSLTEADRLAVLGYLQQKYFGISDTTDLSYQWQFDGTNIANATNATLALTDLQITNDGVYTVIVSNLAGVTASSNAVLRVGNPPSISVQPRSQEVAQGSNVTFNISATGTAPLSFQWSRGGVALAGATNSALTLTNIQSTNAGAYAVTVSSSFGTAVSSNATLTVDLLPVIENEPQSQTLLVGTNVTFSINVRGGSALPSVSSGTLQLWLKADAGVVTNSAGQVSQWQDQSGNANNASQAAANNQPMLVSDPEIGGRATVRFNGIQYSANGSYLQGVGNVGVPNAMTAFTVFNALSVTNAKTGLWTIGVPGGAYGACRVIGVVNDTMVFSAWSDDYFTPFVVPSNTYRIWTDRLDTNLDTVNIFDTSTNSATNFTYSMTGVLTPGAGYYVGGINPSLPGVGGDTQDLCFNGDIAEVIIYKGYLSESDRMAVTNYLGQKYFQIGSNNLTYQWQFDGTNIANATNATLTMTDLQITNDGVYTVIVSNLAGVTTSSNAVLTVGNAPSISVQPQSQEVGQGSNVTFTVSVTGTAPFSFQWSLGGVALAGSTNSALTLTNVQSATAGAYAVTVSSPFGTSVSSNVTLTVDLFPVIETQPQSQALLVGTNVTFSVNVEGSVLPSVSSGTLQLWLKADAGVVTNSAGQVSQWQDQSGNANHASQSVANNQPTLVSAARLAGKPAIRFNGIQDNVNGDYLSGTGNVDVPNALTTFAVYNYFANEPNGSALWIIGQPPTYGSIRADAIVSSEIDFSTWGYDSYSPFTCPTNTYRIWTSVLNSNLTAVQVYDNSATDSNSFSASMANFVTPAAGYYVGGVNPVIPSRCYDGDVVELVCYSGSLTDIDRLAVLGYLQEKYFAFIDIADLSYQWQFDGTNIYNATNASLVLTNLQTAEAGTYTVTVSNLAGVVTSSNAVLTVLSPPVFTSSPSNQSVVAGVPVVFSAAATGTLPIAYQWQFNGVSITNATNTSLTFSDPLAANAGSYTLVATNLYGSATSQVATLSVAESALQVVSASALGGGTVVVSIDLNALGTENFVGFTLNFDPTLLTYSGAVLGSNVGNGSPLINSGSVASGLLGLQAIFPIGSAIPAGTQDLFDVTFQVRPVTNSITTPVTFGSQIIQEWISDVAGNQLPATFASGTVAITVTAIEGDVWPRPNGDHVVTGSDWVEEGLIVAGLVTNLSPSEFQRADCAPRTTLGDGVIDCADWVQVGRYAAGLDPVTVAGGPTGPISQTDASRSPRKADLPRPIAIVPLSQGAATNTVVVQLTASGAEAALGFSVRFDPKMVRFVSASKGSGAGSTASLIQNTNQAAAGSLGFVIGVLSPATFAPGALQLVNLNFASVSCSNNTTLVFSDTPVARQLVDASAAELPASYQTVTLAVGGAAWPVLSISQAGSNVVLTWPATGAALGLQAAPLTGMEWSNLPATPATIGSTLVVTSSMSTNVGFFRLKY